MSDGSFVIMSKGKTIYEGGENKSKSLTRRTRRSNKNNGAVIYPIFKQAIKYAEEDSFWIKILEDASEGIFPKMYRYKDGILSCKKKNKFFSKEINQEDPIECLRNIQDFMKDNGFYSDRDNALKLEKINNLREEESKKDLQWNKIRSKKIKKVLISNYIFHLQNRYSLNNIEQSDLINKIRLATSSGIINNNTVVMENKQIINITVLCFDPKDRDFFIDPDTKIPKNKKESTKAEEEETVETPSIKLNGFKISKSRVVDWGKFTTALGKRLSTHDNLLEEKERPVKLKKKRVVIAVTE